MRILMVSPDVAPGNLGGIGSHVTYLTKHLREHGMLVDVLATRGGPVPGEPGIQITPPVLPEVRMAYKSPYWWPAPSLMENVALAAAGALAANTRQWDVIHCHDLLTAPAAVSLAELLAVPMVVTKHITHRTPANLPPPSQREADDERLGLDLQLWTLERSRAIICGGESIMEFVSSLGASFCEKLRLVPNGVTLPAEGSPPADEDVRQELLKILENGRPSLVHVGRLSLGKAGDQAIECVALMETPCNLLMIGAGPRRREWIAKAAALGVSDRVHFIGTFEHDVLPWILAHCDLMLHLPRNEPFGLVIAEAQVLGLPVIGTRVGGVADQIAHTVTGYLVDPGDVRAAAQAADLLLGAPELRKSVAESARRALDERPSWPEVCKMHVSVYDEAIRDCG